MFLKNDMMKKHLKHHIQVIFHLKIMVILVILI